MNPDDLYKEAAGAFGAALERLVRAYEADPEKRRDLLQEIHFALWRSFKGYETRCSLRTWVYRIAHNTAASHIVRQRRSNLRNLISLEEVPFAPDTYDHERESEDRMALDRLYQLIHQLKPFFVRRFLGAKDLIERIGWGLPIVGSLCLVVPLIYENHKMRLSGNLSFNAGLTTCLNFYRNTLERQRFLGRRWLFGLGTMLLLAGLAALLVKPIQWTYQQLQEPGPANFLPWIPFLIILIIWGISFVVLGRRRRTWLQREFETLESLEKENR